MIYDYNKGQRCLSLLVWLLGVDYVSCTSCTAGSKGHRLLGSLLWGDAATSIFWGVGPNFHAFNESRPPCRSLIKDHVHGCNSNDYCVLTMPTHENGLDFLNAIELEGP